MRLLCLPICEDTSGDRIDGHSVKTGDLREFFSNDASQLTSNNITLFDDVTTKLIGETKLAASVIPEKEYTLINLTVSAVYTILLGLLFTIIIPIVLIVCGIVIFVVRRKK